MTAETFVAGSVAPAPPRVSPAWSDLARIELGRYLRRPVFIIGVLLTYAALLPYLDADEPVDELALIAPAALIGLLGISTSTLRVWASDRCARVAGPTPVTEATRTTAHLTACLLPFVAGCGFVAITFIRFHTNPPPPNGYAALMSDSWVAAVWFGTGAISCLGGPILGVVIARQATWRAAPIVASVGIVALCIVFQGLFAPLRRIRVVMPWTYWGGPFGIEGDSERSLVLSGSPQWWLAYLVALCAIGALVAIRHDRERRQRGTTVAMRVLVAAAICGCLLAMWTGVGDTIVNPIPGSGTSWGG
ncbi:hypothetical protein [Ilumatobacter sp.]|uniref:hypothetical protein n=1 Tax=Ilumatobacter sp. TaxID=1967498 RepID=UPI003C687CF8